MSRSNQFLVVVERNSVEVRPVSEDDVPGVACIFGNSTNRTAYLWHWPNRQLTSEVPSIVLSLSPGHTLTLYYPATFYVRATHCFDRCENPFKEMTVGDKSRRVTLDRIASSSPIPTTPRVIPAPAAT